jgi:hypothetical protein
VSILAEWEYKDHHIEAEYLESKVSTWLGAGTQAPIKFMVYSSPRSSYLNPRLILLLLVKDQVGIEDALAEGKKKVNSLIDEGVPHKSLRCYECSWVDEPTPSAILQEIECGEDIRGYLGATRT